MNQRANALVLSLIGIVGAGLLIVFVLRSRASSAMSGCENNLRQLGIAMHNYIDTYGLLPPAVIPFCTPARKWAIEPPPDGPHEGLPPAQRLSWQVQLFPFIRGGNYIDGLDGSQPWDSASNLHWIVWYDPDHKEHFGKNVPDIGYVPKRVPYFQCPAGQNGVVPGIPSLTDYIGVAGVGADAAELPLGDRRAGAFGYERVIRSWSQFKDGLAQTMMIIETNVDNGVWAAGGFATTRGLDPARPPYLGIGGQFTSAHLEPRAFSVTPLTNVAFADTSFRSLSERITPTVLEALATIAGGEHVDPSADY
jgi:hypothetical protein